MKKDVFVPPPNDSTSGNRAAELNDRTEQENCKEKQDCGKSGKDVPRVMRRGMADDNPRGRLHSIPVKCEGGLFHHGTQAIGKGAHVK